jgi:hypothetical protein
MKLPTLNVDLAVNTKNFKRDLENLQTATGKAIGADKAGKGVGASAMNLLGGVSGLGAVGGPISAGYSAFKFAIDGSEKILMSFADSVENGKSAMEQFKLTGSTAGTGLSKTAAEKLAAGTDLANQFKDASSGWIDSFWAAGMDDQAKLGGALGLGTDIMHGLLAGTKAGVAGLGSILGGGGADYTESVMSDTWQQSYATAPKPKTDAERILELNTKVLRENLS